MAKIFTFGKKENSLAEAKSELRRVSNQVKNAPSLSRVERAESLVELAPALRELMHPETAAPRKVARVARKISKKHKLSGIHPDQPAAQ